MRIQTLFAYDLTMRMICFDDFSYCMILLYHAWTASCSMSTCIYYSKCIDWPGDCCAFVCACGGFNPGEERRLNNFPWSWAAGVLSSAQSEAHEGNMMMG